MIVECQRIVNDAACDTDEGVDFADEPSTAWCDGNYPKRVVGSRDLGGGVLNAFMTECLAGTLCEK